MSNVLVDEVALQSIASAIREKNGTENTYKPAEMPQAILDIEIGSEEDYQQGYNEGYDKGSMPLYYAQSVYGVWRDAAFPENTEITLKFKNAPRDFTNSFYNSINLKYAKIISENVITLGVFENAFRNCEQLEIVDLTEHKQKPASLNWCFLGDRKLKSILGDLDFSECTSCTIWLNSCYALEDISFVPNTIKISIEFNFCPLLTDKSIQSIINGLADLTGQTAQTLTLHAVVGAKLTDEQKATITAKNWILAY